MDKKIEYSLKYEFYGQLLTKRQQQIAEFYYNADLGLSEIAENLGITRQGVYDNIHRIEKALSEFEDKLGLVDRFIKQEDKISKALEIIESIEEDKQNKLYDKIKKVLKGR
jgi:predicted DNA-binding protein YlxM (UPF0122 family)